MNEIDWKAEFLKQKEYSVALEHDRSKLWAVNEELRLKIQALELGQEYLQVSFDRCKSLLEDYTQTPDQIRVALSLPKPPPDQF